MFKISNCSPITTYEQASEYLGYRSRAHLAYQTTIERVSPAGLIVIRHHGVTIIRYYESKSFELVAGRGTTASTKTRMNMFSPVKITQKDFVWYVTPSGSKSSYVFPAAHVFLGVLGPNGYHYSMRRI